jgi:hypothetical protein
MDNIKIELTKKDVKRINDFNQSAKRIFSNYFSFNDNIMLCTVEDACLNKGAHFAQSDAIQPIRELLNTDEVLIINTQVVFKTIQGHRKYITQLTVTDNTIRLNCPEVNESFIIGNVVSNNDLSDNLQALHDYVLITKSQCSKDPVILPEAAIEKLTSNQLYIFENGKYRVRMAKEIIPSLKAGMIVMVFCQNIFGHPKLFNCIISVKRDELISYHKYTCTKN